MNIGYVHGMFKCDAYPYLIVQVKKQKCMIAHIHTYTHTHMHKYTHTHIHTYTHTRIHAYTHTHIHTYTHTHIP